MIISFISVIIPTLNEEQTILRVIDVLHSNAGGYVNEVIVVDGGSNDKTIEKVEQRGVILIKTNFKSEELPIRSEQLLHYSLVLAHFSQ